MTERARTTFDIELPAPAEPGARDTTEAGRFVFFLPARGKLRIPRIQAAPLDEHDARIWKLVDPRTARLAVEAHESPQLLALARPDRTQRLQQLYDESVLALVRDRWQRISHEGALGASRRFFLLFDFVTTPRVLFDATATRARLADGTGKSTAPVPAPSGLPTRLEDWLQLALHLIHEHRAAIDAIDGVFFALQALRDRRFQRAKQGAPFRGFDDPTNEASFRARALDRLPPQCDFSTALSRIAALLADLFRRLPDAAEPFADPDAERLALPFLHFSEGRLSPPGLENKDRLNCRPDSAAYFLLAEVALAAHRLGLRTFHWWETYTLFVCLQEAYVRWHRFPHDDLRTPAKYASTSDTKSGPLGDQHFLYAWRSKLHLWGHDSPPSRTNEDRWLELHGANLLSAFWFTFLQERGA